MRAVRVTPALAERRTTPDLIADSLREAILTGAFQDSEILSQVELARHFGVSRVPVREALRQIQAEGLISVEAHHRVRITGLTIERVNEIFDMRSILETHLLQRAFPHIDAARLKRLDEINNGMASLRDHRTWLQRNRDFHKALYEPSEAQMTMTLVEQLAARNERYLHLWSAGRGVQRPSEAQNEHHEIVVALRRRDLARACAVLKAHIEGTRRSAERLFAERAELDGPRDSTR